MLRSTATALLLTATRKVPANTTPGTVTVTPPLTCPASPEEVPTKAAVPPETVTAPPPRVALTPVAAMTRSPPGVLLKENVPDRDCPATCRLVPAAVNDFVTAAVANTTGIGSPAEPATVSASFTATPSVLTRTVTVPPDRTMPGTPTRLTVPVAERA